MFLLIMPSLVYAGAIGNINQADADGSNVLNANIIGGGMSGSTTPSDNLATPTNAVNSASYLMGYDTSTWDMLRTISVGENVSAGMLAVGSYGYDSSGGNWDRMEVDPNGSLYVNTGSLDHSLDNIAILPDNGVVTANITTATSTIVNAAAGDLLKIIVGVGAASGTAAIYDDATSTCDTNLKGTLSVDTSGVVYNIGIPLSTGICILTNGTANVMVVYRDNP